MTLVRPCCSSWCSASLCFPGGRCRRAQSWKKSSNLWWRNFRKSILSAAVAPDWKTVLKVMRHQKKRPEGKHNHPNKSAAQQQTWDFTFFLLYCKCLLLIGTCNSQGSSSVCGRLWGRVVIWICACWVCMCAQENVESGRDSVEQQKERGRRRRFLYARGSDKAFPCCIRHISSFWSTSLENQFWEMESLDFVCLGQDGTVWSQWVVEAPPTSVPSHPPPHFLLRQWK